MALVALAAALASAAPPARALDPRRALSQHVHDAYGQRDGLPMNSVHAVRPGRDGLLWIATQEGLVRFDGGTFRTIDPRSVPGVTSPWVTAVEEDRAGHLLVGTYGSGLLVLEGGRLSRHPASGALPSQIVNFIEAAPGGDLWIGTDLGAILLPAAGGAPARPTGLPAARFLCGLVGGDGTVWLGGRDGLYRGRAGRFEAGPAALRGVQVNHLAPGGGGALWIATLEHGVGRLEGGQVTFLGVADGLPSADVAGVMEDRDGVLWIATLSGLARRRGGRLERWPPRDTLGSDPIRGLAEDREGNVWVGSESAGLSRFRDGDFVTIGAEEGLAQDNVSTLLEDRHGDVWIGTQAGLSRLSGGRLSTLGRAQGLAYPIVYGMAEDARGDLWIGTNGGGVGRRSGGRFTWYGKAQGLSDPFVRAVLEDRQGRLWVATGTGLHLRRGERFEPVPGPEGSDLERAHVTAIAEDPRGGLWLATEQHGLLRVEAGRLREAPAGPPRTTLLTTLAADADGTLWIGTLGDGVWRLRAGRAAHFTTRSGLFDDVALGIVDDRQGSLWISCNRGVYRVSRAELDAVAEGRLAAVVAVAYGEADGIRGRECNGGSQPSAWRTRDGRLWFATVRGVAVVDPARLRPDLPAPPALVEQAVVDGRPVEVGGTLELPPGTSRLELHVGALGFAGRERIGFRYRLSGVDPGWQAASAAPVAHYTSLPPGRYAFEVQTRIGAGPWAEPGRTVAVVSRPAWHQTAWFAALVAALPTAALAAVLLLRARAHRRREAELAARVAAALAQVKVLSGMLPICAWCKKIKDDEGAWHQLETYLTERSQAEFSHGMCPDCFRAHGAGDHGHE